MLRKRTGVERRPISLVRRGIAVFLVASAMVATQPQALRAQRGPSRVPVTVAVPATFEYGDARFVIVRDTTVVPSVILLLAPNATAGDLSDAVRTVMIAPAAMSAPRGGRAVMRLRPPPGGARRAHPELPWAGRVLSDARRATWQDLPGIGRARAVQIWLPLPRR